MGGDDLPRLPPALRLMGYTSIVLAVIGLAAIGLSVWMRERSDPFHVVPSPTQPGSLPVVGAAPTHTQAVPGPTTQRQPAPTSTPSVVPALPTATSMPTETSTATVPASPTVIVPASPTATVLVSPTVSSPPLSTATPIQAVFSVAEALAAAPGSQVMVDGTVVAVSRFASGVQCTIEDGTGRLTLWLPQNVWGSLTGREAWGVGCTVRAAGTVQLYKEEIELVPQQAAEVTLIDPAPASPLVRVGDLGSQDVGRQVAVQGTIVEVWPFSQGIKYLFDDGSGRIVVLLWQGVLNDVPDKERLVAGAAIHVSGMVEEYNGRLEIIPGLGHEISLAD